MTISVTERFGRRVTSDRIERLYRAQTPGGATEGDVKTAVWAEAPSSLGAFVKSDIEADEQDGGTMWLATVSYTSPSYSGFEPETGEEDMAFSFDGGTMRVTQSLATIAKYPSGTATDHKGAINVGSDGRVDGVEIEISSFAFVKVIYKTKSTTNQAYLASLYKAVKKTNNASITISTPWGQNMTFAEGELRLKNASCRYRALQDDVEVQFELVASENRTGIGVGDLTGIEKKGWEYLWVEYAQAVDTTTNKDASRPIHAYVERVYDSASFSALGIGS